jgi:hypothetical protein
MNDEYDVNVMYVELPQPLFPIRIRFLISHLQAPRARIYQFFQPVNSPVSQKLSTKAATPNIP